MTSICNLLKRMKIFVAIVVVAVAITIIISRVCGGGSVGVAGVVMMLVTDGIVIVFLHTYT